MWDEEGLEPLGDAATTASIHTNSNTTHHIGSFDSDLNSIVSKRVKFYNSNYLYINEKTLMSG